jgi:hypothetical protein
VLAWRIEEHHLVTALAHRASKTLISELRLHSMFDRR